ncbi:uncharacterized protein LOC103099076 isoform X2 [Monodelphis domestica]|uniref:uncharacterized protein LOC103099076 isoform X2 n=1 Tax=Monodelphis domestica TaxID=13616 RepID=UPI0024E2190A|nr:uncharacterized protein LOC103099076 isoform X2 [Monodelphis domestica]
MKPKTLRISRGVGGEERRRCHGNQAKGGCRSVGGRYAAVERSGELAALRAARALSHRGGRPQKRGGTRCRGSRAQASPNPGGSPFLARSGMESLLPRYLKAPTGRLPAGTRAVGGKARVRVPDFHRSTKIMKRRGKDWSPCDYYRKVYHSLCPLSWVQRWTDQIREGTFPGKI